VKNTYFKRLVVTSVIGGTGEGRLALIVARAAPNADISATLTRGRLLAVGIEDLVGAGDQRRDSEAVLIEALPHRLVLQVASMDAF
jgi:hypothetical protein